MEVPVLILFQPETALIKKKKVYKLKDHISRFCHAFEVLLRPCHMDLLNLDQSPHVNNSEN